LKLKFLSAQEVSKLVLEERFQEFEDQSHQFERSFESDPLWESSLTKLYTAIEHGDDALKKNLDTWVQLRPSYVSYTARGAYEVGLAYRQRGTAYAQVTPPESFARMQATMAEAQKDLENALASNPKFIPAYIELLEVVQAVGSVEAATAVEKRATREVPTTYYLRYTYLANLRPRWGGSYELMTAYEDSLTEPARLNPRIWSLKGQSWAERAYTARENGDAASAIMYYTHALTFGDRTDFLKERGTVYLFTHQFDLALKDFTRFREYNSTNDDVNHYVQCIDDFRNGRPCIENTVQSNSPP
jgi:tetratricopeptide (TPR) repeat protein